MARASMLMAAATLLVATACGPDTRPALDALPDNTPRMAQDADKALDLPAHLRVGPNILALSGGGPDGAFGAGYLVARPRSGCDRADTVTGVSIGALIGTLAFAGETRALEGLFAEGGATRLAPTFSAARALLAGSLSDGAAYRSLLGDLVTDRLIARVAAEHRQGRRLYVATTDLDAMRMTAWDMGRIAVGGRDQLFRAVLLASASVPGAYPVVWLPDARGTERPHVDGGATGQIYVPVLSGTSRPSFRLVFNNGLGSDPPLARHGLLATVQRSLSTLLRAQTRQQIALARAAAAKSEGQVSVAAIPPGAPIARLQDFSAEAMAATFARGARAASQDGC